jgi:hypothetical protein
MSVFDTIRRTLKSISERLADDQKNLEDVHVSEWTDVSKSLGDARDVIDDALLDPLLRIIAEQQYSARQHNTLNARQLLQSRERITAFVEQEEKILRGLGAKQILAEAFFRDLSLGSKLPLELLEASSPDEIYHRLDKLRDRLRCTTEALAPNPPAPLAAPKRLKLAIAGVIHATCGVGLIVGNGSALAALIFTAPIVSYATQASVAIGGYACSRAYTRLTEALDG